MSEKPWQSFYFQVQNEVTIEDVIIINRPNVKIEYMNAFGEKTQTIQLESPQSALVSEMLYDELGRQTITTKTTRVNRSTQNGCLLCYRPNFATNKNPSNVNSVWNTSKLTGEVQHLNPRDQGFPFTRVKYFGGSFEKEEAVGYPGVEYSLGSRHAKKINYFTNITFINNLFPVHQGFRHFEELLPNGNIKVSVFDQNENEVARYSRVIGFDHLLSTYEYDEQNRLVKVLPPVYHEKMKSEEKATAWNMGNLNLTTEEKHWQGKLGTHLSYDERGNLVRKQTPDSGTVTYMHDSANNLVYMVFSKISSNQTEEVVNFEYDELNRLTSTGHLERNEDNAFLFTNFVEEYHEVNDEMYKESSQVYQEFDYDDENKDVYARMGTKWCVTNNNLNDLSEFKIVEKILFDKKDQVIGKSMTLMISSNESSETSNEYKKKFIGDKMTLLEYPFLFEGKQLALIYEYNRLGQLVSIHTNDRQFARFNYSASGLLEREIYQASMNHTFTRLFSYNSPGMLEKISDPFLTENISHTERGYGQASYENGIVMKTSFNATWSEQADSRWFQLSESELSSKNSNSTCRKALIQKGYLSQSGEPLKQYIK